MELGDDPLWHYFVALNHNTAHCARNYRFKAGNGRFNSGISKRLKIIKEDHPDIENVDVTEESLDNIEVGIIKTNERLEKNPRVAEFKKIERKFFKKEACPNLLTWAEKEQIRFLYNSDPTTWSPDKLSECFPATADVIKKLLKSQWKPISPQRIINHDTNVKENWKALENGHLNLPDFINSHIKSFISRSKTLNLPSPDKSLQTVKPAPTSTEFLDVIKNFKNKSSPSNDTDKNEFLVENNVNPTQREETYVLRHKNTLPLKHKYYTLNQLKKELSDKITNDGEIELKPKDVDNLKESQPKVDSGLLRKPLNVLTPTKHNNIDANTTLISGHTDEIPLKINIPKEKRMKSKTHVYKVNDCYYDSNGEFVYKVPGMV